MSVGVVQVSNNTPQVDNRVRSTPKNQQTRQRPSCSFRVSPFDLAALLLTANLFFPCSFFIFFS
jgi:hypothetical protein